MTPIRKQDILRSVLLSIVTLGVYGWIWQYRLIRSTESLKTEATSSGDELFLMIVFPFYSVYWWASRSAMVGTVCNRNGVKPRGKLWMYILFALIPLCGVVNAAMMQKSFNDSPDVLLYPVKTDAGKRNLVLFLLRLVSLFPLIPYFYLYGGIFLLYAEPNDPSTGNMPIEPMDFLISLIALTGVCLVLFITSVILRTIYIRKKRN